MVTLHLITIAALLPCLLCQQAFNDPLCKDMVCPTNQVCRHYKPCGERQNCNVTAICSNVQPTRGGCLHGNPVLFNNNGKHEELSCYNGAPCPSNAYCSTELQDVASVCCLSNPVSIIRAGVCPRFKPDPSKFWCVDECRSDGDCYKDNKCCHTGCSKECIYIQPVSPPPPIDLFKSPPPPRPSVFLPLNRDPCAGKVCPNGQSCRHYKPCGLKENCDVIAMCTAIPATRGGCRFGDPVLYNNNGTTQDLTCYPAAPCPRNSYCSTQLQDIAAVCCLSDPAEFIRQDMICPVPVPDPNRYWCVDECKSDGDCDSSFKCCFTGCSRECVPAGTPPPPPTQPPPPTAAAPIPLSTDPCVGKVCPSGQICRYFKPCGQMENCTVTSICTAMRENMYGCIHGSPVLHVDNGKMDMLSCWLESPCPSNAYCSTVLADAASRCCLTDPAKKVKSGTCPAPQRNPYEGDRRYFCYDECKHDGDCDWDHKCCNTGCKLECTKPETTVVPSMPPIPPAQPMRQADPCDRKVCPSGQVCRYFKPCGQMENCTITSICTAMRANSYGCKHGSPVLHVDNGKMDMLSCWLESPCPSSAYCSTVLADAASRCCLTDPAKKVKSGTCPAPQRNPYEGDRRYFCYDECKHDGDCDWDFKCCNTGCKLECTKPETIVIPTLPPVPPVPPRREADPCDSKVCPANTYCRKRGQPCRNRWSCRPVGSCNRCPFLPLMGMHSDFTVVSDPDGCLAVMPRKPVFAPRFGRPQGGVKINPWTYLLFSEYFNKK